MEGKIQTLSFGGLVLCIFGLIGSVLAQHFLPGQALVFGLVMLTNILGLVLSLKAMGLAARERLSAPLGVVGLLLGCVTALVDVLAILPGSGF